MAEMKDIIEQNAAGPRKASGDGHSAEAHSLADQIAADKHLASRNATRGRRPRLLVNKATPPGTV